jgi:hypothetical protein
MVFYCLKGDVKAYTFWGSILRNAAAIEYGSFYPKPGVRSPLDWQSSGQSNTPHMHRFLMHWRSAVPHLHTFNHLTAVCGGNPGTHIEHASHMDCAQPLAAIPACC